MLTQLASLFAAPDAGEIEPGQLESQPRSAELGVRTWKPRYVLYRRELELASQPAVASKTPTGGTLGQYLDAADANVAERRIGKSDTHLALCDLICVENRLDENGVVEVDGAATFDLAVRQIDTGKRALVVELALVVLDDNWQPDATYVSVQLEHIGPLQRTNTCIGDRDAVLARSAAASASESSATAAAAASSGAKCRLSSDERVDGWCVRCGLRPNIVTLFQTPLGDRELVHYADEICAQAGTHGHTTRLDDSALTIEVSEDSTLARDIRHRDASLAVRERYGGTEAPLSTGVMFVGAEAWHDELTRQRRVLNNLPLVDLYGAKIRIAARHAGSASGAHGKLRVVLTAQCIEFVR